MAMGLSGCIICSKENSSIQGKPRFGVKAEQTLSEKEFKIMSCRNCGFTYVIPDARNIAGHIQNFYDGQYFESDQTNYWKNKRI